MGLAIDLALASIVPLVLILFLGTIIYGSVRG